jgi:hypothetical protein
VVGKAPKSHGVRSGLYGGCSDGVPPIHFFQAEYRIQFRSHVVMRCTNNMHSTYAYVKIVSECVCVILLHEAESLRSIAHLARQKIPRLL